MTSIEFGLQDIDTAARRFLQAAGQRKHFAFYGVMGAGKTTFIAAVCKALGVQKPVTSPTFALVNEYETGDGSLIHHFDFYRIGKPEEAFDFGCEEYFAPADYCFVEWAEKAETALPENICKVYVKETEHGVRQLTLE
jgi:tRNA threonylcarbamoyladenosine biosynthesis protein TsaE